MSDSLDPALFNGLSVYQDVVLEGRTVRKGVRNCEERWAILKPQLPHAGAILDIGSNFGWFGLKICESRPECVVASVEADPRSALIQRKVLESHEHRGIALLTAQANRQMLAQFAAAGQRFDAALCLSILHWLPEHREFLTELGRITKRIIIEYPHPDEADAGSEKIRREIGEIEPYLSGVFPTGRIQLIGECSSHLSAEHRRPILLVEAAKAGSKAAAGVDVRALLDNDVSWPPRSWWLAEYDGLGDSESQPMPTRASLSFTACGLQGGRNHLQQLRRKLENLPEETLYPRRGQIRRRVRQVAGTMFRRVLSPLG